MGTQQKQGSVPHPEEKTLDVQFLKDPGEKN